MFQPVSPPRMSLLLPETDPEYGVLTSCAHPHLVSPTTLSLLGHPRNSLSHLCAWVAADRLCSTRHRGHPADRPSLSCCTAQHRSPSVSPSRAEWPQCLVLGLFLTLCCPPTPSLAPGVLPCPRHPVALSPGSARHHLPETVFSGRDLLLSASHLPRLGAREHGV